MDTHLANMKNQKKSTGKIICKVVTATINRALSCERSGASAPGIVKIKEDNTMFQKIRSLFNKKNKDEIQTRYEEITVQNNQLLNRLLSEDKELIKKYNM